eukprot:UN13731
MNEDDFIHIFNQNVLTIARGKIIETKCDEQNGYKLLFDSFTWTGMSGGAILLASDPMKFCGSLSYAKRKKVSDIIIVEPHSAICSNHPLILKYSNSKNNIWYDIWQWL